MRITTWNVNGIRNPFGYQPWRERRTFEGMFEILGSDIVVMQELKIQRKDLQDDMVMVPGWDCFFSLPRQKKGYSGVGVYTKQATCVPIRAEEGITGVLPAAGSSTAYRDLPKDRQIGGYLTNEQLAEILPGVTTDDTKRIDALSLDSEGRCVILEFPAFVLLGVYCPANSSGTRDDFRYAFFCALDQRIRNLDALGKRVFLTGDLNVSSSEIDSAGAEEDIKKMEMTHLEYISTPNRRLFNQLLDGAEVVEPRDPGREMAVLWDICRGFHPTRKKMYTHWEQKINARPGNYGGRIDFVLASTSMKGWFAASDIQEGLMGSDHCPVYADFKEDVFVQGKKEQLLDIMNPHGMFANGVRQREVTGKDSPAFSAKLLPEFGSRRTIRDMFSKPNATKGNASTKQNHVDMSQTLEQSVLSHDMASSFSHYQKSGVSNTPSGSPPQIPSRAGLEKSKSSVGAKRDAAHAAARSNEALTSNARKKVKLNPQSIDEKGSPGKKQQSLKGFFLPGTASSTRHVGNSEIKSHQNLDPGVTETLLDGSTTEDAETVKQKDQLDKAMEYDVGSGVGNPATPKWIQSPPTANRTERNELACTYERGSVGSELAIQSPSSSDKFVDPIESKESWDRLFSKPVPPLCETHDEPCVMLLSKKRGVNFNRSFYLCARPLGPTGQKASGTQWRCTTFIWASDWDPGGTRGRGNNSLSQISTVS